MSLNFLIDFREERGGRGGGEEEREGERQRETQFAVPLIYAHWLLLSCALTRDGTRNLGAHWVDSSF